MPRRRKTPKEGAEASTQSSQASSSSQQRPTQEGRHGRWQPVQPRPPAPATHVQSAMQVSPAQPSAQTQPSSLQGGQQPSRTQAASSISRAGSTSFGASPFPGSAQESGGHVPSPYSMPSKQPFAAPLTPDLPQAVSETPAVHYNVLPSERTHQTAVGPTQGPVTNPSTQAIASTFQGPSTSTQRNSTSSGTGLTDVTEQLQSIDIQGPSLPAEPMTSQVHVPTSSKKLRYPLRPGFGKAGRPCLVKANHFLAQLPKADLHHYDVSIVPEILCRGVNRAVIKQLVNLYLQSDLGCRLPVYDGGKSLYTAGTLPFQSRDFIIKLDKDEEDGAPRRERQFKVAIKFVAKANLHHLGEFLSGRQPDAPQDALQVLDIVLRELPTERFCPVGRSFFSSRRRHSLGGGLESWQGFYQSIRPTQMGLSLNIDMSATAFIEPLQVLEFVNKLLGKDVTRNVSRPLIDADRIKIRKALRGVKIQVTHRGDMRRKYRIADLTSRPTQELTFPIDDQGTMKSVVEYFKEVRNYVILYTALPCLQVGNQKRPNYLPMEVCQIVKGQRYSRRLNEKQISELLRATCQRPLERERSIIETVYDNDYGNDEYAKEFGLNISKTLAEVEARILPAPQLKYHDTGKLKYCQPEEGYWNMKDKKVVNGGQVKNWICINFSQNVSQNVAQKFCRDLAIMCQVSGMIFRLEPAMDIQTVHPDEVEGVLRWVLEEFSKSHKKEQLDLILAILPDNNGTLYGDLKRICETDLGLLSQCCLTKQVLKAKLQQYLANVALKINVKVGGRNTVLADALNRRIPLVTDKPTIIFGADVTHPHPGEDSSPSIAAVVASQDWPEVTKYAGLVCAQEHREELIQDLFKSWNDPLKGPQDGGMIRELLLSFWRNTRQKPDRIIFYRDGVSEGQFYQVLLHELDAIRKACASLEQNYQPRVTFVVVQKRHHTRLFPRDGSDRKSVDASGNIYPGTVVDRKICHPTEFDFYLCSHAGIQGTSRPAHYHVLWDENNFTADNLQILTNNLCYTYARCTRSVSIVPPAYYAHLAAFRARFYMEPESESGSGKWIGPFGRAGSVGLRGSRGATVRPLPALKDNVKRVMFYC
ncbi:hypothetical protein L7F22_061644 [Adiantum nelumboides]|nr:hypothetical protein [Adiantum nelumboides]